MPVYLIQSGEGGPVKIGKAASPKRRLAELQTAHHAPLTLLRLMGGGAATEAWLHRVFQRQRIRGEWFRYDATMLSIEIPQESDLATTNSRQLTARQRRRTRSKLDEYFADNDIAGSAFASRIGISPSQLNGICSGSMPPSPTLLHAIIRETNGSVTALDFLKAAQRVEKVNQDSARYGYRYSQRTQEAAAAILVACGGGSHAALAL